MDERITIQNNALNHSSNLYAFNPLIITEGKYK